MAGNRADFTLTFRRLSELGDEPSEADASASSLFEQPAFDDWAVRWRRRLASEVRSFSERRAEMRSVNQAFIPRNHRVEEVIVAATRDGDFRPFETLLEVLASPYEDQPGREEYAAPPRPRGGRPRDVLWDLTCGT